MNQSKHVHVAGVKRRKTRDNKSQLVLVFTFSGRASRVRFFGQSQSVAMQNKAIDTQLKNRSMYQLTTSYYGDMCFTWNHLMFLAFRYDGETFVKEVDANYILWEQHSRTGYQYSATMKQV